MEYVLGAFAVQKKQKFQPILSILVLIVICGIIIITYVHMIWSNERLFDLDMKGEGLKKSDERKRVTHVAASATNFRSTTIAHFMRI